MKSQFNNVIGGVVATGRFHLINFLRFVVFFFLSACAFGQAATPQNNFVIRNARIFDGTRVIPQGDVWIQNGMIKAVGPHIKAHAGIPEINAAGKTLLPGLIDAHVHTMGQDTNLKSALALGITTEFDMGAAQQYAFNIKREQAEGKHLDFADLRASEIHPTAPDGHGTEYAIPIRTISSPEEAQDLVDAGIAEGDDFIGEIIYDDGSEFGLRIPTLSKATLQAVIEAAHRRGKLAIVHVLSLQAAKDAIAAGADGLAHLFADRAPDDEFISLVTQHHAFVIPTLSVLAGAAGVSNGPSLAGDPRLMPYLTSEAITDLLGKYPRNSGSLSNAEEAVRKLSAQGIPILAGTDAHNLGTAHGASLLGELELLANAGLTPVEALKSATSVNAAAFQLDDRGQIVPGKRADLLLIDGNPTTRISDIRNVAAVWKLGVKLDRDAYRAELERTKEAEEARRHAPAPAGSESGVISDFEGGTATTSFGLGWRASAGSLLGGHKPQAQINLVDGGANGSRKALQITGEIMPGVFGWAGAMFFPGPTPMAPVTLSSKKAISVWTKGDGRTYQVMLFAKSKGAMPLVRNFIAGSDWKQVVIPFSDFGTDASDLQGLMMAELGMPGPFSFSIDDVRLEPQDKITESTKQSDSPESLPFLATSVAPATTSNGRSLNGWDIRATSYRWLQGMHGDISALGRDIGFKASPTDLASRAKLGAQEAVAAQFKRLTISGDILWTPLEVKSSNSLLNPAPAALSKSKYNPLAITPEIGYRLINSEHLQIDGLAGLRYWRVGADFTLAPALGGVTLSKTINWIDPLVGARIKLPVSRNLTAMFQGDAGGWGSGSQLDYQVLGAFTYQLKPKWALDAGWRYMYTDYSDNLIHSRVAQSGIILGVTYTIKGKRGR